MNSTKTLMLGIAAIAASMSGLNGSQHPVNLGTAGDFTILSKAGISTTGSTAIVGNIGVSPIDSTAITGFGFTLSATGTFATSSLVTGGIYASDFTSPTPSAMTTAISDMEIAYADASGRISGDAINELGAGNISGQTLAPGLYKWGTGLLINSDITLSGPSNAVWIFQISQDLTLADGVRVILSGGAQASRIFWQVAGEANFGTTSHFEGIVLSNTAIHLKTGASINGALYAHTATTLDANSVVITQPSDDIVSNWFGTYNVSNFNQQTAEGWIYHFQHGWLYLTINPGNDYWLWNPATGDWLWTMESVHPYFYNATSGQWYHLSGSSWQAIG